MSSRPPVVVRSRPLVTKERRCTQSATAGLTHSRVELDLFGSRFSFNGCRTPFESARPSARVLRGDSRSSFWILVCATGGNPTRRPRPRLPHVRSCRARALLRGVSRKGRDAWVAALAEAPTCAPHRAWPRSSSALRHAGQPEMEPGGRVSTCGGSFHLGGSHALYEVRSADDAGLPPTSAPLAFERPLMRRCPAGPAAGRRPGALACGAARPTAAGDERMTSGAVYPERRCSGCSRASSWPQPLGARLLFLGLESPVLASRPRVTALGPSNRAASPHRVARRSVPGTSCMDASSAQTADLSLALSSFSGRRGRTVTGRASAAAFARITQGDSASRDPCRRLKGMAYRTSTSLSSTLPTKSW